MLMETYNKDCTMRILVIEDNNDIGNGITKSLKNKGYIVDWFTDGEEGQNALLAHNFDTVILDIQLPKRSGFEILKHIRQKKVKTPVIMISAVHETTEERVMAFNNGADDFLSKPIDIEELPARIMALQRRMHNNIAESTVRYGSLELDLAAHNIRVNGKAYDVPRREFILLTKLLRNIGHVLSHDQLIQALYGWNEEIKSNTLEVHIHNIRKKFGNVLPIRTIRGVGYLLEKET